MEDVTFWIGTLLSSHTFWYLWGIGVGAAGMWVFLGGRRRVSSGLLPCSRPLCGSRVIVVRRSSEARHATH